MPARTDPLLEAGPEASTIQHVLSSRTHIRVLQFVLTHPLSTSSEIFQATGISDAHRILRKLEELGIVQTVGRVDGKDPKSQRLRYVADRDQIATGFEALANWLGLNL